MLLRLHGALNVANLIAVYEDADCVHLVMELCRGGELLARARKAHYSERTVRSPYSGGTAQRSAVQGRVVSWNGPYSRHARPESSNTHTANTTVHGRPKEHARNSNLISPRGNTSPAAQAHCLR